MTIDEMRVVLGLDASVPDDEVVQAYVIYLEGLPQAAEPLSLTEAKAQLGILDNSEDARITGLIIAAREYAENYTGLVLTARPVTQTFDTFGNWLDIDRGPVRAITSVTYYDADGEVQTLEESGYTARLGRTPVRIVPSVGSSWPQTQWAPGVVEVTYDAGYALPEQVPQAIKQAMLLMIRHWFDNSSAVIAGTSAAAVEMPLGVAALLDGYRVRTV